MPAYHMITHVHVHELCCIANERPSWKTSLDLGKYPIISTYLSQGIPVVVHDKEIAANENLSLYEL